MAGTAWGIPGPGGTSFRVLWSKPPNRRVHHRVRIGRRPLTSVVDAVAVMFRQIVVGTAPNNSQGRPIRMLSFSGDPASPA